MLIWQTNQRVQYLSLLVFLNKGFKFKPNVCNGCHHDVLVMSMKISDTANLNIKGAYYHYIISGISNSEATNVMENIDLTKKVEHYKTTIYYCT